MKRFSRKRIGAGPGTRFSFSVILAGVFAATHLLMAQSVERSMTCNCQQPRHQLAGSLVVLLCMVPYPHKRILRHLLSHGFIGQNSDGE